MTSDRLELWFACQKVHMLQWQSERCSTLVHLLTFRKNSMELMNKNMQNDVYDTMKWISISFSYEFACLLMQGHTNSLLLYIRFLRRHRYFVGFMKETLSYFWANHFSRFQGWLWLGHLYLFFEVVESCSILLGHFEQIVILIC